MANNELRVAMNAIEVQGAVKEQKLNKGKGDKGEYINGSLVIKAGEFTEVEVKVFVQEKNGEGKVKKAYETLESILDGDYPTMAKVSEEEAVKVSIWGRGDFTPQLREEMFKDKNTGDVVTKISLDLGFGNVNIKESMESSEYKATFDVEMYVNQLKEEVEQDEETGRILIEGFVPVYGGSVMPLTVVAGKFLDEDGEEYDFAEDIRGGVEEGGTINIWGDIDFKKIVTEVKKGGGMGKAKTEKSTTYINDFVATGADIVSDEKAYEYEEIESALKQREIKKDEVKNKESKPDTKAGRARGSVGAKNKAATSTTEGDKPAGRAKPRF